ncbi:MAG: hypothetical protein J6K21_02045 [Bacilli bacterium]|nr:hypothetical protein [Bacilli bacterium]
MGFEDKFIKNCKHKLVYDYGYMKRVCYKQHTQVKKEEASYRDLRCIQCGKDLSSNRNEEMFERIEGIISYSNLITYNELFNLYDEESKNNSETECIENVKKKVYQR